MNETMENKRLPQFEGLRFVMCCVIIVSHLEFLENSARIGGVYVKYFYNPTMAVDYFFMLSGFGLCLSTKRPTITFRNCMRYAIAKIEKIYFAYIVSLMISMPAYFLMLKNYGSSIKAILKTVLFFTIDITCLQSLTGVSSISHSINGVCWFLSCIFICYAVAPVFLCVTDKIRSVNQAGGCLAGLTLLIGVLSDIALQIEGHTGFDDLWYGHPFIRCWYLAVGMIIGVVYKIGKLAFDSRAEIPVVGISLIYYFTRNSFWVGLSQNVLRLIDVIMCASLLLVISGSKGKVAQMLSKDYMVKLGQLTMFLFIFHYPARMIVTVVFDRISGLAEMGEIKYPIEVVCIIGITIALTYIATYKEQHLKKLLPDNN